MCLIMVLALVAGISWATNNDRSEDPGPGRIHIQSMQAFGELQLPPVLFAHDLHTEHMAQAGKGCETCHPKVNDRFVFTFSELEASSREEAKRIYHDRCVQCHRSEKNLGNTTGPLEGECRACHQDKQPDSAAYADAGMNLALHARHIEAEYGNCGACHHSYDPQSKKLVPAAGDALGCRACHQEEKRTALSSLVQAPDKNLFQSGVSSEYLATKTPPSWSQSAHLSCLNCHIQANDSEQDAAVQAPVSCQGCHGQDLEPAQTSGKDRPRLTRGQPDAAFITPSPADIQAMTSGQKASMQPVPFDHKAHEQATDTCRACHHESSLQSCSQCHGPQGSEQGGMISLDQAMHGPDSKMSCVGCHWQKTQDQPRCAGCHTFQKRASAGQGDNCRVCHDPRGPTYQELLDMPLQDQASRAQELVQSRGEAPRPSLENIPDELTLNVRSDDKDAISLPVHIAPEDIVRLTERISRGTGQALVQEVIKDMPQEVMIDKLSDQYGPVRLPHARIAAKLQDKIASNTLADAFHQHELTLCQGCHHQSPPSQNPPSCGSCHDRPFSQQTPVRPGLKAAYHQMCMDCHDQMNITEPANTDCSSCHEQKRERIISDIK